MPPKKKPVEDLTPLIQAALAGTLGDDTVIAHTRSQVNAKYQPGVDKVGAGLAALRRANPGADLRSVDHAALYQQLVDGSLQDENGLAIKLANRDELYGAKKVTDTCLKITASDPQGGVMTYLTAPDATRKAVKGVTLAPVEDLTPLIQAALAGTLGDDTVIAHTRSQVHAMYQPGVDKVGAGLAALRRANPGADLRSVDHAALYQQLVDGSLQDENGLAIKLANPHELNGAKKVTDTCLKITASDPQGGVMTYLTAPDATRKAVKGVTLAPVEDLTPLIQAALAGTLGDDTVIAHTRSQVHANYQPGVDKVGAGLAALRRANPGADLRSVDHAALYQQLVDGSLQDENGLAIKLANPHELYGAKKVTDTCLKITASDPQGGVMTYLTAPDATRKAVKGVTLAPVEDLTPLIQAALAGTLGDDTVIAHTRSQVHAKYQPGVDKVGAGLAALRRANPGADLRSVDHAALYQQLVDGSLQDENGLAIKLANRDELNGAKKVTDTCLKITASDPQGGVMTYLTAPDATRKAVKGVTLAPVEDLTPLIQAALAGTLGDDTVIAHTRSQVHANYQPGVDKVGAGLAALRRANPGADLRSVDHAALYQQLVDGSLQDENGLAIKLANPHELNGAKKVTDTCLKITASDPQGGVMTYLTAPDATRKAVKGVTLAPVEDLTPLIQAALAGTLGDDTVIAHTRSQVHANYQPGVDKVGAGLAALRRANPGADLRSVDHAALYQQLVDGSLQDENGLAIKLANPHELNGAKKVTDTCLKITASDPQGGVMTYLTAPDATRKAVKGVTLAPVEDLTPLIQAALAGTLGDDTVIAHTRSQVNANYQPGVDKVGAGLAALRRANPGADLRSVDHAALYQQLVDGSLQDENGLAIKLANPHELNGAKKVTDTCLKITASDPQGGVMTYLTAPDATRKAVKGVTLAPVEDLTPLIQAALAGTLGDDTVIAHTRSQVNANYQPGVDKVGAGLAALRRANPGADLRSVDHAALYQQLVDGSLQDENGLAIKLANRDELYGAKKVTDTCLKITASDPQGGVMTYLTAPDATRKAVKGVTLAPVEDLTPLIQAALAGTLGDDTVIAHTRSQVNANYQPGVDKVGAGLAALRRANPGADLRSVDHAALYQQLVDGSLQDENGLAIKLANRDELYGAKKVTDTCLKITASDPQGGVMTYLTAPDATRKAVAGLKNPFRTRKISSSFDGSAIQPPPGEATELSYDGVLAAQLHDDLNPGFDVYGQPDPFRLAGPSTLPQASATMPTFNPDNDYRLPLPGVSSAPNPWGLEFSGHAGSGMGPGTAGDREPVAASDFAGFMSYPQTIAPDSPRTGAVQPPFGSTSHLPGPPESAPGLDDWRGPSGSVFSAVTGSNPPSSLGKRRERDGDGDQEPRRQPPNPALSSLGLNTLGLGGTVQPEQGSDFEFRTSEPGVPVPYVGQTAQTRMDLFRRLLASGVEQTHAVPYAPPHEPPPGWDQHGTPLPASSAHSGISPSIYATPGSHVAYPHSQEVSEISGRLYPLAGDGGTHPFQGAGFDGSVNVGSFQIPEAVLAQQTPAVQQADASLLAGAYHGTYPLSHAQGRGPSSQGPQPGGGWSR